MKCKGEYFSRTVDSEELEAIRLESYKWEKVSVNISEKTSLLDSLTSLLKKIIWWMLQIYLKYSFLNINCLKIV